MNAQKNRKEIHALQSVTGGEGRSAEKQGGWGIRSAVVGRRSLQVFIRKSRKASVRKHLNKMLKGMKGTSPDTL